VQSIALEWGRFGMGGGELFVESVGDSGDDLGPVGELVLAEEAHGGVPGGVFAV